MVYLINFFQHFIYSIIYNFYLLIINLLGVVNPDDLTITLSDEIVVGTNIGYGIHHTVIGLNMNTFLIGFYNGTVFPDTQSGPISVIVGSITGILPDETIANGQVNLGETVKLDNKIAAFNIASSRVDNTSAIFTFADVSTDFGITTILVTIDSKGLPTFGSSLSFSSGRTLSLVQTYLIMDLDVAVISTPSTIGKTNPNSIKFSVLYSDITNNGILTTSTGMVRFYIYTFIYLFYMCLFVFIFL